MLERQDLLKDLRLVLGSLAGHPQPTHSQVEEALGRAEIDGFDVANIRGQCGIRALRDRIRPVVALVGVSNSGLDDVRDLAALTAWLSEAMALANGKPRWSSEDLVAVAREARNDFEMGYSAGRVLGEMACLPKWNAALKRLGRGTVRNERVGDQAKRYLDQAARSLRAFARYVATACPNSTSTEGDHPSLDGAAAFFSEVSAVHESLETTADWRDLCAKWSERWWEVPFSAVLDALRVQYERIDGVKPHLHPFETEEGIEAFKLALKAHGVTLEPDPLDVARNNHDRLSAVVRSVWELYQAWLMMEGADWQIQKVPEIDLNASMYLRPWSDDDVLIRAKNAVDEQEFLDAVTRCTTITEMRTELQVSSETLERIREKHRHRAREETAQKRTVNIAGTDYEVGGPETYSDLFRRLKKLPEPIGPRAENDVLSPLGDPSASVQAEARAGSQTSSPADGSDGSGTLQVDEAPPTTRLKTAHVYSSPHRPELVGIVGEMHAFRFLKSKFNIDECAWVSEFRTKVLPLRKGETDQTSDSLGYDFRFEHDDKEWYVEVKATTEDGTSFDISAGQLAVARRIAAGNDERWRILRVRRALSKQPECDWLPNPFESDVGQRLRLRQGSMTVEYALSKNSEDEQAVASTLQSEPEDK